MDGPVGEPLAGTIANQQFSAAIRTALEYNEHDVNKYN